MKIFGRTIFAKERPSTIEQGATGTVIFSGQMMELDYNPELRGTKGLETMDKMRKSDGQVKAALLACTLPLLTARWDIKPASDSARDQDIAEAIANNLFKGMTITWDSFLRQALLMLAFGHSVFEKVWVLKDGIYQWRKLAPRAQKTVSKWYADAEGGLSGIEQRAFKADTYQTVDIPVGKLLVFTHEQEGSNFQGISLLRAAYKHWYIKNNLYIIDGIAAERHGIGLAVFNYPKTTGAADKTAIDAMGQRLHAHERAYLALPDDVKFSLIGVAGQLHNILGSIDHHDLQIVRSILAQFINLGSGEVGSYALSQDQSGFFLMALQSVGRNICDTFNRYALRQMVDYNWDVKGKYPELTVSGLEVYEVEKFAKALTDMGNAGFLTADEDIESELRRRLHLPLARPGAARAPAKEAQIQQPEVEAHEHKHLHLADWAPRRELRGAEMHIAFRDIKDKLDGVADEFVKAAAGIQKRQIKKLVSQVADSVAEGEIERITSIDVPYRDDMANSFESLLVQLYDYGQEQVKQEMTKQKATLWAADVPVPPDSKTFLRVRALAMSNIAANKMRAAMAWEALHQIKEGIVDRPALTASLTELSDRDLRATAKFSASEAFNMGRQAQAKEVEKQITNITSSALLDENTCPFCASVDGKEFTFADEAPPYSSCEGEDRCRCVWVYTFKEG